MKKKVSEKAKMINTDTNSNTRSKNLLEESNTVTLDANASADLRKSDKVEPNANESSRASGIADTYRSEAPEL